MIFGKSTGVKRHSTLPGGGLLVGKELTGCLSVHAEEPPGSWMSPPETALIFAARLWPLLFAKTSRTGSRNEKMKEGERFAFGGGGKKGLLNPWAKQVDGHPSWAVNARSGGGGDGPVVSDGDRADLRALMAKLLKGLWSH